MEKTSILLLKLENLIEGVVVNRPSRIIKSPYVADIQLTNTNINEKSQVIAHSPSLGCCGLANKNTIILCGKMETKKTKKETPKCEYVIYLSIQQEQIIGIHPKLAEKLVESALQKNCLSILQNIKKYKKEVSFFVKDLIDSRFDFVGIDNNDIPFIMEVKNVPLADYEDLTEKERKKIDFTNRDTNSKVAYFPDGYRKKSTDTVSPRALKHIRELTYIKEHSITRCIMCYVIQRTDANRFQPSIIDPEYRHAVKEGMEKGVEIITMVVDWTKTGEAYFVKDNLPITTFE